jgi:hypothetical protein
VLGLLIWDQSNELRRAAQVFSHPNGSHTQGASRRPDELSPDFVKLSVGSLFECSRVLIENLSTQIRQ